jgi:dethiobiotin synthetase
MDSCRIIGAYHDNMAVLVLVEGSGGLCYLPGVTYTLDWWRGNMLSSL